MLSENTEGSTPQETPDQGDQTVSQTDGQSTALSEEKAYAKKMRNRAQDAEKKANELQAKLDEQKNAQLAEQGKWKEMYEDLKTKSTAWENDSNEYQKFMSIEKDNLLQQLPEEDRDTFKDLKLPQLKKLVDKVNVKPDTPKVTHGAVGGDNVITNKAFDEMTEAEREKWHNNVVNSKS